MKIGLREAKNFIRGKQRILSVGSRCVVQLLGVRVSVPQHFSLCYKGQLEITMLILNKSIVLSHHTGLHHYKRDLINFLHCYTQYSKWQKPVMQTEHGQNVAELSPDSLPHQCSSKDMRQNQFYHGFFPNNLQEKLPATTQLALIL